MLINAEGHIQLAQDLKVLDKFPKILLNLHSTKANTQFFHQPYVKFLHRGVAKTIDAQSLENLQVLTGAKFDMQEFAKSGLNFEVNEFYQRQALAHLAALQQILVDDRIRDDDFVLVMENDLLLRGDFVEKLRDILRAFYHNEDVISHVDWVSLSHSAQQEFKDYSFDELVASGLKLSHQINVTNVGTLYYSQSITTSDMGMYLIRKRGIRKSILELTSLSQPAFVIPQFIDFKTNNHVQCSLPLGIFRNTDSLVNYQIQGKSAPLTPTQVITEIFTAHLRNQGKFDGLLTSKKYLLATNEAEAKAFFITNPQVADFQPVFLPQSRNFSPQQKQEVYQSYNRSGQKISEYWFNKTMAMRQLFAEIILDPRIADTDFVLIANGWTKFTPDWYQKLSFVLNGVTTVDADLELILLGLKDAPVDRALTKEEYGAQGIAKAQSNIHLPAEIGLQQRKIAQLQHQLQNLSQNLIAQGNELLKTDTEHQFNFAIRGEEADKWMISYLERFKLIDFSAVLIRKSMLLRSASLLLNQEQMQDKFGWTMLNLADFFVGQVALVEPFIAGTNPQAKALQAAVEVQQMATNSLRHGKSPVEVLNQAQLLTPTELDLQNQNLPSDDLHTKTRDAINGAGKLSSEQVQMAAKLIQDNCPEMLAHEYGLSRVSVPEGYYQSSSYQGAEELGVIKATDLVFRNKEEHTSAISSTSEASTSSSLQAHTSDKVANKVTDTATDNTTDTKTKAHLVSPEEFISRLPSFSASLATAPAVERSYLSEADTYVNSPLPQFARNLEQAENPAFLDFLGKTKMYLINMQDNVQRREFFYSQPNTKNFIHFPAVAGKALSPQEVEARFDVERFARDNGRKPTPGEIGCTLSHVEIYKQIIADDSIADNQLVLISEDDAILHQNWYQLVNKLIAQAQRDANLDFLIMSQVYINTHDRFTENIFVIRDYIDTNSQQYREVDNLRESSLQALVSQVNPATVAKIPEELHIDYEQKVGYSTINNYQPCASAFYLVRKSALKRIKHKLEQPAYWYADGFNLIVDDFYFDTIAFSNPILGVQNQEFDSDIQQERLDAEIAKRKNLRQQELTSASNHWSVTKLYIVQLSKSASEIKQKYPHAILIPALDTPYAQLSPEEQAKLFNKEEFKTKHGYEPSDAEIELILAHNRALTTIAQSDSAELTSHLVLEDWVDIDQHPKLIPHLNYCIEAINTRFGLGTHFIGLTNELSEAEQTNGVSPSESDQRNLNKETLIKLGIDLEDEESYCKLNNEVSCWLKGRLQEPGTGFRNYYLVKKYLKRPSITYPISWSLENIGEVVQENRFSFIINDPQLIFLPEDKQQVRK